MSTDRPPPPAASEAGGSLSMSAALAESREALALRTRQVQALYRAGDAIAAATEEAGLIRVAADMLVTEIGYLNCWVGILDEARGVLRNAAVSGKATDVGGPASFPLDDRRIMAVDAFHAGRPVVHDDVFEHADAEGWGEIARASNLQSAGFLPLRAGGRMLGVLGVGSTSANIEEDELALLAAFANQLAGAIARVRMDREREEQVQRLQQAFERQAKLLEVVRELSTPVIPVHDGVLVLPLVGTIDSGRSAQVMDALLSAVQREGASVVILDVTGVPVVDSAVANHLLQAVRAASLLGARCVIVGISPLVAQTMVQLGIDLSGVVTRGDLQDGIAYALRLLRLEIRPMAAAR